MPDPSKSLPPYRLPCLAAWPPAPQIGDGSPFQRRKNSDSLIASIQNLTKIRIATGGPWIDPKPLADKTMGGGGCPPVACTPGVNCTIPNGIFRNDGAGFPPGHNAGDPYVVQTCAGGTNTPDYNCFAPASSTGKIDLSDCLKLGFKAVQARKTWHGMFGPLTHEPSGRMSRKHYEDNTCVNDVEDIQLSADQTKYLQLSITSTGSQTYVNTGDHSGDYSYTATANITNSVDRTKGVSTVSCSRSGSGTGVDSTFTAGQAAVAANVFPNILAHVLFSPKESVEIYREVFGFGGAWVSFAWAGSGAEATTDGISWTATHPGSGGTTDTMTLNCETGAFHYVFNGVTGYNPDPVYGPVWTEDIAFTSTGFTHTIHYINICSTTTTTTDYSTTGVLSQPYSATQLWADCQNLLATWDMTDDLQIPWRRDEFVTVAPLVTYDECQTAISPALQGFIDGGVGDCASYVDPNAAIYTGRVLGLPLQAGTDRVFDWDHATYANCTDGLGGLHTYPTWHGAWAAANSTGGDVTDVYMPRNCQQWTNNKDACYLFPGAFSWYDQSRDQMWVQKYAESRIPRPSYNFARPCGRDRYVLAEQNTRCVWQTGGTTANPIVSTQLVLVLGDTVLSFGNGGITPGQWTVQSVLGATHTVEGDFYNYVLANNWPLQPNQYDTTRNYGTGVIGKQRWPGCAPIGGRTAIAGASNTSPIRLTMDARWLQTGDALVVSGCPGNTAANGSWTITVVDQSNVTLNGSTGNGNYTGGGFAGSTADRMTHYTFDDDNPKGDFLSVYWQFNYRDYQEQARVADQYGVYNACTYGQTAPAVPRPDNAANGVPQALTWIGASNQCLPWSIVYPVVMCWTPNGEAWTNGLTLAMSQLNADKRYGALWQGGYVQHWPDPLWVQSLEGVSQPVGPCYPDGVIFLPYGTTEDTGICTVDDLIGNQYYRAHHPVVEARNGVPVINGATPTLPAGIALNLLNVPDISGTYPAPSGIILQPPSQVGNPGNATCTPPAPETPWGFFIREVNCACNKNRFAPGPPVSPTDPYFGPYNFNGVLC